MAPSMPSSPVHHPVFARLWSLMSQHEPAESAATETSFWQGCRAGSSRSAWARHLHAHSPATVEEVVTGKDGMSSTRTDAAALR